MILGPPTPSSKSALAQLLASVQSTGETRQIAESSVRQVKQASNPQVTSQKRKRSTQKQEPQPGMQVNQGLTPAIQKNLKLLMEQQQPQQGSYSGGQIVLGQQPLLTGKGRYYVKYSCWNISPKGCRKFLYLVLSLAYIYILGRHLSIYVRGGEWWAFLEYCRLLLLMNGHLCSPCWETHANVRARVHTLAKPPT